MSISHTHFMQAMEITSEEFMTRYGVSREVFQQMARLYQQNTQKKRDGRGYSLNSTEQVLFSLQYCRGQLDQARLARDWGVHRATAIRILERVRGVLVQSAQLRLPESPKSRGLLNRTNKDLESKASAQPGL